MIGGLTIDDCRLRLNPQSPIVNPIVDRQSAIGNPSIGNPPIANRRSPIGNRLG
jgi:hypothetical protein